MRRTLKTITALVSAGFISNAFAVGNGFYMGLMTGPASNTAKEQEAKTESGTPPMTIVKPRTNQWGTRIYAGNKFNPYAGFEAGMTYYSTIAFNNQGVDTCGGTNARVRTIDFLGKVDYEAFQVNLFAKGGLAVTYLTTDGGLNSSATECGRSKNEIKYRPAVALGVGYNLDQSWVVDLTWTRTMVGSVVNNVDFFALGLSYHFVDRYCGQFLCD